MRIRRVTTHLLNGESIRPPIGGFGWRPRTAFAQSVHQIQSSCEIQFQASLAHERAAVPRERHVPHSPGCPRRGTLRRDRSTIPHRHSTLQPPLATHVTQCVRLAVNEHRSREVPVILRTPSARVRIIRRGLCQFLSYDVFCLRRPTHAQFFQSFVNRIDQRRFPPTQLHELANKLLNARKRLRSFFRRIVLVDRLSTCLLIPVV